MTDMEQVAEVHEVQSGQLIMPFYIICDVSSSMSGAIGALNTALGDLQREICALPVVDDVARLSVLTFSTSATVALPLGQVSGATMPTLSSGGGTNYGSAFSLLARTVDSDRTRLKAQGFRLYRPCAFFLTDGGPTDPGWEQTFKSTLTYDKDSKQGMKGHPIFVPFGFDAAPEPVMQKLAYPPGKSRWYLAQNASAKDALLGILEIIMQTVVSSSMSAGTGQKNALVQAVPAAGSGIRSGESYYDD